MLGAPALLFLKVKYPGTVVDLGTARTCCHLLYNRSFRYYEKSGDYFFLLVGT